MTPEMEIMEIKYNTILCASNGSEEGDGDMNGGETF